MLIPAILAATVMATPFQGEPPVVSVTLDQTSGVAGSPVKGKVTVTFAPGLHGYQNPPSQDYQIPVSVSVDEGFGPVKLSYPAGEAHTVGGEAEASFTYSDTIEIPFLLKTPAKAGKHQINVKFRYQQCTESMCFPPKTITQPVSYTTTASPKGWTVVSAAAAWAKALAEWKQ